MADFPPLDLATWHETRDTLQIYAKLLGKIQQSLIPPQQHFWHYGLLMSERGLKTQPIIAQEATVELTLDLTYHLLEVSDGAQAQTVPLAGQTAASICKQALAALAPWNLAPKVDLSLFADETSLVYDPTQAQSFAVAMNRLARITETFHGKLPGKTSPVLVFPHHFDLSLTWFSGRKVPGQDPQDEEASDESMTFGFSPGDEGIPEAYLYVTAYPTPDGWSQSQLPPEAHWQIEGWIGAVLPYKALIQANQPDKLVSDFFQMAWQPARDLMVRPS